jgi:hypothetical protein
MKVLAQINAQMARRVPGFPEDISSRARQRQPRGNDVEESNATTEVALPSARRRTYSSPDAGYTFSD